MSRRTWKRLGIALLAMGVLVAVVSAYLLRDPRPRIERRRARLLSVTTSPAPVGKDPAARVELVHLRSTSGLDVQLAVKRPAPDSGKPGAPRPLVLLLGGHRTGRDAVHLIDDTEGTIVAALSYPY